MSKIKKLRLMTLAFLKNGNDVLLLQRAAHKKIYPNYWSGVGGHIESDELHDLKASCLREIEEETGIPPEGITTLEHLYLILRQVGDELWQTYIYIGTTNQREIVQSDEGVLQWVPLEQIFERSFIPVNRVALTHYLANKPTTVHLGLVTSHQAENPIGEWLPLFA